MRNKIDFIGIGMPKSASTWVQRNLNKHPQIFIPRKECTYFFNSHIFGRNSLGCESADVYKKGLDWYFKLFKPALKNQIVGEVGTSYMVDKVAAKRIHEHFPNVKILVTLRNPVDMLQSLFWWNQNQESLDYHYKTFEEAVREKAEEETFLKFGYYHKYLKTYYKLFPKKTSTLLFITR